MTPLPPPHLLPQPHVPPQQLAAAQAQPPLQWTPFSAPSSPLSAVQAVHEHRAPPCRRARPLAVTADDEESHQGEDEERRREKGREARRERREQRREEHQEELGSWAGLRERDRRTWDRLEDRQAEPIPMVDWSRRWSQQIPLARRRSSVPHEPPPSDL